MPSEIFNSINFSIIALLIHNTLPIYVLCFGVIGLVGNISYITYKFYTKKIRTTTIFILFLCVNNILNIVSWDYSDYINPFIFTQYLLLSATWRTIINFVQYWSQQWYSWILVNKNNFHYFTASIYRNN